MTKLGALLAAGVFIPAFLAGRAEAIQITGSSGGSFSGLSNCDSSGSSQDCQIGNTSNGSNTQVKWGSTSSLFNFVNPSTLTSVDTAISAQTNADDVRIAHLNWYNSATSGSRTPDAFQVSWTLSIAFTSPNASSDTEVFNLTITNPTNPPGDNISGFTLADLSNLSFSLNGVTISDLKYMATNGTSLSGTTNKTWYNPEYNTGDLYITADFSATKVPEPMSIALLGSGLIGLGIARRRKA